VPRIAQRVFAFVFIGLVPAACSTHPLPEDVTGLPISQIVHQIQCEAAREVKGWHAHQGFGKRSEELATIDTSITDLSTKYKSALGKLQGASDYGTSSAELQDAFDAINLQLDQVQQKINGSTSQEHKETLQNEAVQLYRQYTAIIELENLYEKASKLDASLQAARTRRREKRFEPVIAFESNNAAFQFVFQVTENNNATSKGTITWPIVPGVITLGYDVGDKRRRESDRQVKLAATFKELVRLDCSEIVLPEETRLPRMYPITGTIGLDEVIWDYMVMTHRIDRQKGTKFQSTTAGDSYRDKIRFTTTINGALKPGINLSKRMGQLIEASADIGADRMDVHELTIYLTPPGAPTAGSPQEVIIKQMPAVRVRARALEQSPAG
jgi:uncharacterized protein YukE